jgi:hypothetical protein
MNLIRNNPNNIALNGRAVVQSGGIPAGVMDTNSPTGSVAREAINNNFENLLIFTSQALDDFDG